MVRKIILLSTLAMLAMAAPARAYFIVSADGVKERGHIQLAAWAERDYSGLVIGEALPGGDRVLAHPSLTPNATPIHGDINATTDTGDLAHWKCTRRSRTFYAEMTAPDGRTVRTTDSVRTPSCAGRLELQVARSGVTVTDSWGLGGIAATVTGPHGHARRVRLPPGTTTAHVKLALRRGEAVSLRTRWQRERLTLGAKRNGGATVLVTGDSMTQNLDVILEDKLAGAAHTVSDVRLGNGYTHAAGDDNGWPDVAAAQVARDHPRVTVLFLGADDVYPVTQPGGGSAPCCGDAWQAEVDRRVRTVLTDYTQHGAGTVIALTIPLSREPQRRDDQLVVNAILRKQAAALPGVVLVPADELFTPGGVYRATQEDRGHQVRVREPDGIHLSLAGARIAARPVLDALRQLGIKTR